MERRIRNLQQYPVTWEEKIGLLQKLIDEENAKMLFGSMRPMILNTIMMDMEALAKVHPEALTSVYPVRGIPYWFDGLIPDDDT